MDFCLKLLMGTSGLSLTLTGSYMVAPVFILDPAELDESAAIGLAISLAIGLSLLVPGWMLLNKVLTKKHDAGNDLDVMPHR